MARRIRVTAPDGQLLGTLSHVVAERGSTRPVGLVIERNGDERILPLTAVRSGSGEGILSERHAREFHELAPFVRTAYRVIDEEMEMQAEIDEDFQVGWEEPANHEEQDADRRPDAHGGGIPGDPGIGSGEISGLERVGGWDLDPSSNQLLARTDVN